MRYPHVDVMSVIEYALHMSDPKVQFIQIIDFCCIVILFCRRHMSYHLQFILSNMTKVTI